jgi:hypothetical protein
MTKDAQGKPRHPSRADRCHDTFSPSVSIDGSKAVFAAFLRFRWTLMAGTIELTNSVAGRQEDGMCGLRSSITRTRQPDKRNHALEQSF